MRWKWWHYLIIIKICVIVLLFLIGGDFLKLVFLGSIYGSGFGDVLPAEKISSSSSGDSQVCCVWSAYQSSSGSSEFIPSSAADFAVVDVSYSAPRDDKDLGGGCSSTVNGVGGPSFSFPSSSSQMFLPSVDNVKIGFSVGIPSGNAACCRASVSFYACPEGYISGYAITDKVDEALDCVWTCEPYVDVYSEEIVCLSGMKVIVKDAFVDEHGCHISGEYKCDSGVLVIKCPEGSVLVDSQCIINITDVKIITDVRIECPSGSNLVGDECVVQGEVSCPKGSELKEGVCKSFNIVVEKKIVKVVKEEELPVGVIEKKNYNNYIFVGVLAFMVLVWVLIRKRRR